VGTFASAAVFEVEAAAFVATGVLEAVAVFRTDGAAFTALGALEAYLATIGALAEGLVLEAMPSTTVRSLFPISCFCVEDLCSVPGPTLLAVDLDSLTVLEADAVFIGAALLEAAGVFDADRALVTAEVLGAVGALGTARVLEAPLAFSVVGVLDVVSGREAKECEAMPSI
jgi:hypothetical protein